MKRIPPNASFLGIQRPGSFYFHEDISWRESGAARWRMIRMTVCFRKSTILFAVAAVLLNYQFFSGVLHLWVAGNLRWNRESGLTIGVNSSLWKITMAKRKVCESIWERKSASGMLWKAHVGGIRTSANTCISVKASSKMTAIMELGSKGQCMAWRLYKSRLSRCYAFCPSHTTRAEK